MVPGLEERLMNSSEEEVIHVADMVCQLVHHRTKSVLTISIRFKRVLMGPALMIPKE